MPNDYEVARKARKNPLKRSPELPASDKKTLSPGYLLGHENHFDPNVITPEQLEQNTGMFKDQPKPIVTT